MVPKGHGGKDSRRKQKVKDYKKEHGTHGCAGTMLDDGVLDKFLCTCMAVYT